MSWPLAFSTLGCSGLPLADVAALARTTGWTWLELRAAPDEPVHVGLSTTDRRVARETLESGGARPLAIASYVRAAGETECVADTLAHARLAKDLGCRFVRVFPGAGEPGPGADARAVGRLREIAADLPDGVDILLETHDSHPRGADVARVLAAVDHPRVNAIWDVLHPWRHGEAVEETAATLAPWLAHVQIKDARSGTDRMPVFLGDGAIPLGAAFEVLGQLGYRGALSLEWEAKWYPEAPPLTEALSRGRAWLAMTLTD